MNRFKFLFFSVIMFAFAVMMGSLFAYGTASGTVISNAKTFGQSPDPIVSTNSGDLSAEFNNGFGTTNFGQVINSSPVQTTVTPGYDISQLPGTTVVDPAYGSAGSYVDFPAIITNFGNLSDDITVTVQNLTSGPTWTVLSYAIYTNGVLAAGPNNNPSFVYQDLAPGNVLSIVARVYIDPNAADGETNRIQLFVHNGAALPPGDNWPGPLAISPSVQDTGATQRDYQTAGDGLLVIVQGPIIRLSKNVDLNNARPYEQLLYTISYTNAGSAGAQNLLIQDVLPSEVQFDGSFAISTNGGAFNPLTQAQDADDGEVVNINSKQYVRVRPNGGTVGSGQYGVIRFRVRIK